MTRKDQEYMNAFKDRFVLQYIELTSHFNMSPSECLEVAADMFFAIVYSILNTVTPKFTVEVTSEIRNGLFKDMEKRLDECLPQGKQNKYIKLKE